MKVNNVTMETKKEVMDVLLFVWMKFAEMVLSMSMRNVMTAILPLRMGVVLLVFLSVEMEI